MSTIVAETTGTTGTTRTTSASTDATYVLGRSARETQRLIQQSGIYAMATRRLFEEAGIGAGMKVLDVGSGAGDVALLAADLVGPTGAVVGVDVNPLILETARSRAGAAGLAHVSFRAGDFRTMSLEDDFDAIVGRLILLYVADPAEAMRALVAHLRPGGIAAFQEMDFTLARALANSSCLSPLNAQLVLWAAAVFERAGAHVAMGRDLHRTLTAAGLPAPHLSLHAPLGADDDWAGYGYVAESFRSALPRLEQFGIAGADEVDVDTLAGRLRTEATATAMPTLLIPMVGAWTHKPGGAGRRSRAGQCEVA